MSNNIDKPISLSNLTSYDDKIKQYILSQVATQFLQTITEDQVNEIVVEAFSNSNFITSTVDNLANYYLKTEVDNLLATITTVSFQKADTLPSTGQNNIIYLIPNSSTSEDNIYDEYIYIDNNWELIGNTKVDLSDYVTKEEIKSLIPKDGASAYEIAVAAGFEGTEAEWLASLKGDKGDIGPQGEKGDTGSQGIQGIAGNDGYSPTVIENANNTNDVYKLDITNAAGSFTTPNLKGKDSVVMEYSNAGFHNSIYRGSLLGSYITDEQYTAIANGSFENLFIGDYWLINGFNWIIAGFDYWLNCGDTKCTQHHMLLIPETVLYTASMNDEDMVRGAYPGSMMYSKNLSDAKSLVNMTFNGHILSHREYFPNAISNGYPSDGAWYDSEVDLMNENMVCGSHMFTATNYLGTTIPEISTIDKTQLPLFRYNPSIISIEKKWFLRDTVSSTQFSGIDNNGNITIINASEYCGVRPVVGIVGN